MELDELKSLINHKLATDHAGRSAEDIAALLTKKTVSVIGRLKRNLWIEIIGCIVVIAMFGYLGIFGPYHSFRIYFSVFGVLSFLFWGIIVFLLRRTNQLSATALPVKSNLEAIVKLIDEFSKRYFQFTMALIPICFVFAFFLGYNEQQPIPKIDSFAQKHFSSAWQIIAFALGYMILLSIAAYYFTKWYLRKQYGRITEQLKECIRDLGD